MMISLHKNATTTPSIRQRMSGSLEPAAVLALRYGVSEETARKWKRRDSVQELDTALIEIAKRAPKAVIGLTSALSFHQLTDQLPRRVWIAIGAKDWAPKIDYPQIRIVRFREPYLTNGLTGC